MSLLTAVVDTGPTSYWPLAESSGTKCYDKTGLNDATLNNGGVNLAVIAFGSASAPYFDGEIGSTLTVANAPQYSQSY